MWVNFQLVKPAPVPVTSVPVAAPVRLVMMALSAATELRPVPVAPAVAVPPMVRLTVVSSGTAPIHMRNSWSWVRVTVEDAPLLPLIATVLVLLTMNV